MINQLEIIKSANKLNTNLNSFHAVNWNPVAPGQKYWKHRKTNDTLNRFTIASHQKCGRCENQPSQTWLTAGVVGDTALWLVGIMGTWQGRHLVAMSAVTDTSGRTDSCHSDYPGVISHRCEVRTGENCDYLMTISGRRAYKTRNLAELSHNSPGSHETHRAEDPLYTILD